MSYLGITNQKDLTIEQIFSIHYFEYTGNFFFEGENKLLQLNKTRNGYNAGSIISNHVLQKSHFEW